MEEASVPLHWQDESSDCTTLSSTSPSSTPTTEANDDVSTASESELESVQGNGSDDRDEEDEDKYSKKRHRRLPPPIFFGTPKQAEHEKRERYASQIRTRRLLRKDSMEMNRRKSIGMDWGREDNRQDISLSTDRDGAGKVEQNDMQAPHLRKAPNAGLAALAAEEDDISALTLSDEIFDSNLGVVTAPRPSKECQSDSDDGDESSSGCTSDEGSVAGGDQTIRVQDAFKGLQDESLDVQLPSTPTKQIIRPLISRPSLAVSDADSSPGIALALHPSSASNLSPSFRPSPANCSKAHRLTSPLALTAQTFTPLHFSTKDLELELEHRRAHSISPRKSVLKESPSKLNQAISPSKTPHTSSPTKAVVRQTLSAWAHAKLKTPQSPEKKEWEKKHAEAHSPCRSSLSSSTRDDVAESSTMKAVEVDRQSENPLSTPGVEKPFPPKTSMGGAGQEEIIRPASRIARPVPVSRLPKPVKKSATPTVSNGTSAKRMVLSGPAPTFRRIANGPTSSNLRPVAATASHSLGASKPQSRPAPLLQASGPFRPHATLLKTLDRSSGVRTISSVSSSPLKEGPSTSLQRSTPQFSSPFKRTITSSTPIVRDARLFAAPRRAPEIAAVSSSSSASSPNPPVVTEDLSLSLVSSTSASTPVHSSTSAGAARRIAIARETVQIIDEQQISRTQKIERVHDEKRVMRIKELIMKGVAAERIPSSDGSDDPQPNPTSTVEAIDVAALKQDIPTLKVESAEAPRSSRRKHEKQSTAKTGKPTPSSSVFSSTSANGHVGGAMPLSKTELSRLTSLHTQRNEKFVSQLETIVVRKTGENRPLSPSSKIRKSVVSGAAAKTSTEAKEARKQRARKRTPDAFGAEDDESLHDQKYRHRLGAGEEEIYTSPPRSTYQHHQVRWHKSLFCGPNDALYNSKMSASKGCLRNHSFHLDPLGNVLEASQPWSPRLIKNKVTVYKVIYDDDEQ